MKWFAFIFMCHTVLATVSSKRPTVVVDTGWYMGEDIYIWGYVNNQNSRVLPTLPATINAVITSENIAVKSIENTRSKNNLEAAVEGNGNDIPGKTNYDTDEEKLRKLMESNATIAAAVNRVCSPYNPPVPDFNAPGRRLSDVKCQEYIWNIENEVEKENRILKCADLKADLVDDYSGYRTTIGGRDTLPGEFPHMGAIGWKGSNAEWQFKCGGSLISPNFILTAAHCSQSSGTDEKIADPIPKIVRLSYKNIVRGLPSKTRGEYDINISKIIVHPDYVSPRKYYDIALMELEEAVGFSQLVQPSCLWGHTDTSKLGSIVTLTGWGVLAEDSVETSPELQAAVLDVIETKKCERYLGPWCNRNWCKVRDHQMCAGKLSGGVDACQGDSGSPIQVKIPLDVNAYYNLYYVISVTSFGVGCAQPNLPVCIQCVYGVYTRVSSFIDWIEGRVWLRQ